LTDNGSRLEQVHQPLADRISLDHDQRNLLEVQLQYEAIGPGQVLCCSPLADQVHVGKRM
jgi:hypothetical protein